MVERKTSKVNANLLSCLSQQINHWAGTWALCVLHTESREMVFGQCTGAQCTVLVFPSIRNCWTKCLNLLETTHGLVALDFTWSPLNCWHYQAPQQVECLLGKALGLKGRAQFPDPAMLMDQDTQNCYLILKPGILFCRFPAHIQIACYKSFFKNIQISLLALKGYQRTSSCSECGRYLHRMPSA